MANKINDTSLYPITAPAANDLLIGTDVSNTSNDANGETVNFTRASVAGPVLIEEIDAAGLANVDFTNFDNTVYKGYMFELEGLTVTLVQARMSADGGSTWISSVGAYSFGYDSGGTYTSSASSTHLFQISASSGVSGSLHMSSAGSSSVKTSIQFNLFMPTTTSYIGGAARTAATTNNGLRFIPSTGTFTSGKVRMYGY